MVFSVSLKFLIRLSFYHGVVQNIALLAFLLLIPVEVISDTLPVKLTRQFPTESSPSIRYDAKIKTSPVLDLTGSKPQLIVAVTDGAILFLDAETGEKTSQVNIPRTTELRVLIAATPALVGSNLIVLYQMEGKGGRESHRVAVIDIAAHKHPESVR